MTGEDSAAHGAHGLHEILAEAERAAPGEAIDVVAAMLKRRFDATDVSFLIVDLLRKTVTRLTHTDGGDTLREIERITLSGDVYDRVVRTQRAHREPAGTDGADRLVVPVTNRGETLGLLELDLPAGAEAATLRAVEEAARFLAYVVIANQRFTDLYLWGRRTVPIPLAAEIQYRLLPPSMSCEAAEFAITGSLEPSHKISGDTFDYALGRRTLHLSITDPMGHDVNAALLATLLLGALRGARRAGGSILDQAHQAHQALVEHDGGHATGQLLRLDLREGRARFVNAGHPWPLRMRDGEVQRIPCEVDLPFGLPFPEDYHVQELELRPGDRLVLLTDGMLERRAENVDLAALLKDTRGLHPREAALALTTAVMRAAGGDLEDDATVMVLDWHGARAAENSPGGGPPPGTSPPARQPVEPDTAEGSEPRG